MAAKTRDLGDQAATKRFQLFVSDAIRIFLPDYAALTTGREGPCYSRCKHQVRLPLVRRTG